MNRPRDFMLDEFIFTDTNIFAYHTIGHSRFGDECTAFLDRVEAGDCQAVTTDVVINEVIYFLQIHRGADLLGVWNRRQIEARIAADATFAAECWQDAEQFMDLIDGLERGGLIVVDVQPRHYRNACAVGKQLQFVVSDATHIVICQQFGIEHIASNDADFDRVPFLTRWEPRP